MIFSTSWGKDLDKYITAKNETVVFSKSGRKIDTFIRDVQEKIPKYLKKYKQVHVYFLIGIPDITMMERRDDYEEVTFKDSADFVQIFIDKTKTLLDKTKELGGKPCMCTVASTDISAWNNHRLTENKTTHLEYVEHYKDMQDKLEKNIIKINKSIIEMNISNEMKTPLISDTILKKKNNGIKKYYSKFIDGVHPNKETNQKWGILISEKIDYNFDVSMDVSGGACSGPTPHTTKRPSLETQQQPHPSKKKC